MADLAGETMPRWPGKPASHGDGLVVSDAGQLMQLIALGRMVAVVGESAPPGTTTRRRSVTGYTQPTITRPAPRWWPPDELRALVSIAPMCACRLDEVRCAGKL